MLAGWQNRPPRSAAGTCFVVSQNWKVAGCEPR